jgi:hypothetical protein
VSDLAQTKAEPAYIAVPVAVLADVGRVHQKDAVILLAIDHAHKKVQYTSWGKAPHDKVRAAELCDLVAEVVSEGEPRIVFEDFRLDAAANKYRLDQIRNRVAGMALSLTSAESIEFLTWLRDVLSEDKPCP